MDILFIVHEVILVIVYLVEDYGKCFSLTQNLINNKMDKFKEDFLDKVGSDEIIEISQILDRVNRQEKLVEVIYYALVTMSKSDGNMSPLLALQIAEEDWNI